MSAAANAIGAFCNFIEDEGVLIGCEAAGRCQHRETAATYRPSGHLPRHGKLFLSGRIRPGAPVYSISAGLDYPGIGPEHAYLHDIGRAGTFRSPTTKR
ncbi:MAG: hypothetical protein ACLT4C_06570 [Butyricicoccus sp.]